jgi:site-specific DNA-methyltransferase (adenine-specific)
VGRLFRDGVPAVRGLALEGDARDAGLRVGHALHQRALPATARLVVTSPPYLRVVRYGTYNWLRLWFLGLDAAVVDATLDTEHRLDAYLVFLRDALRGIRPVLADDAVVAMVIGDVETDRGKPMRDARDLAGLVWEAAAAPEGYRLAGVAVDEIAAQRKVTKIWGEEAGRATRVERILVMSVSEAGRRRALAGASLPVDWRWPPVGPRPA